MLVSRIVAVLALLIAVVATAAAQPSGNVFTQAAGRAAQFFALADGTAAAPAYSFNSNNGTTDQVGCWKSGTGTLTCGNGATGSASSFVWRTNNQAIFGLSSSSNSVNVTANGDLEFGVDNTNNVGGGITTRRPANIWAGTQTTSPLYNTTTKCANTGSPAVCAAAAAGSVVIAGGATSVVVNTTSVTANSQIFVMIDRGLGTLLSVTCDATSDLTTGFPAVTARTAATSFTVAVPVAPAANPMCLSYFIVN